MCSLSARGGRIRSALHFSGLSAALRRVLRPFWQPGGATPRVAPRIAPSAFWRVCGVSPPFFVRPPVGRRSPSLALRSACTQPGSRNHLLLGYMVPGDRNPLRVLSLSPASPPPSGGVSSPHDVLGLVRSLCSVGLGLPVVSGSPFPLFGVAPCPVPRLVRRGYAMTGTLPASVAFSFPPKVPSGIRSLSRAVVAPPAGLKRPRSGALVSSWKSARLFRAGSPARCF